MVVPVVRELFVPREFVVREVPLDLSLRLLELRVLLEFRLSLDEERVLLEFRLSLDEERVLLEFRLSLDEERVLLLEVRLSRDSTAVRFGVVLRDSEPVRVLVPWLSEPVRVELPRVSVEERLEELRVEASVVVPPREAPEERVDDEALPLWLLLTCVPVVGLWSRVISAVFTVGRLVPGVQVLVGMGAGALG